jgi:hypothetical protein
LLKYGENWEKRGSKTNTTTNTTNTISPAAVQPRSKGEGDHGAICAATKGWKGYFG